MDNIQLGKRLKNARLMKKMTQSEVVGDYITRNMLSQIESGVASPSIKTLEFLAGVLEIPLEQLVSDGEADMGKVDENTATLLKVKEKFRKGDFHWIDENINDDMLSNNAFSDELSAILAKTYLELSKTSLDSKKYKTATNYAEKAILLADNGIYAARDVKTQAVLLLDKISDLLMS